MDSKKKNKKNPMEILWICMMPLVLFMAIKVNVEIDFHEALPMYIAFVLCVGMYFWRRHLRIKEDERKDAGGD